jgi:hypothetical protein
MGHSSSAAALRYQHVMAGRDAAIAAALDELVEAAVELRGLGPLASCMPLTSQPLTTQHVSTCTYC